MACTIGMDVPEAEHVIETVFLFWVEAAERDGRPWVLVGAEQDVPEWYIGVIVRVVLPLVMNPVRFWSLKDGAKPERCFDVPVIE